MKPNLKRIDGHTEKIITAFISFVTSCEIPNLLFPKDTDKYFEKIKKICICENKRTRAINNSIERICKELSLSPDHLKENGFLYNGLIYKENTLSDLLASALNESPLLLKKFLTSIIKIKISANHKIYIEREDPLWDKDDLLNSGRADMKIDIYGKHRATILIEHKINHLFSIEQIKKYCYAGENSINSYFVLITSKDSDLKIFNQNTNYFNKSFNNPPLVLTHLDLAKAVIHTSQKDPYFSSKFIFYWLFEIIKTFSTQNILYQNIIKSEPFFIQQNKLVLNILEAIYD